MGVKVPQFTAWVLRLASGLRYEEHYDGQWVLMAPFFTLSFYHGTLESSSHQKEEYDSPPLILGCFMICFGQGDVSRRDRQRRGKELQFLLYLQYCHWKVTSLAYGRKRDTLSRVQSHRDQLTASQAPYLRVIPDEQVSSWLPHTWRNRY